MTKPPSRYDLTGQVAVVTGGAGMLGGEHAAALLEIGAAVALLDVDQASLTRTVTTLSSHGRVEPFVADVSDSKDVEGALAEVVAALGRVDVLVNNAARDPKVGRDEGTFSRLESFQDSDWEADIAVGLGGAFRCARSFGGWMASHGGGVILNIASDLAVIAPDQRIYRQVGVPDDAQPVKPVSYSVVKTGLIGLTRYLATYWAESGVRANALSPGGVFAGQPADFVAQVESRIPLGRMASADEYRAAIQFLCSNASAYMTGQNVVMDGGRSVW